MSSKFNFQVKASSKRGDTAIENQKLVRKFLQKWKKSGIQKELRDRQYPVTKGEKRRLQRRAAVRRSKKS